VIFSESAVTTQLNIWERITITVGSGPSAGRYVSRIEDFLDHDIVIDPPDFIGGKELLHDNCDILVYLTRSDAVYQFASHLSRVKHDGKTRYVITRPDTMTRLQRRQYVRIRVSDKIQYAILPSRDSGLVPKADPCWQSAGTVDLSGGGILVSGAPDIQIEDRVLMQIPIFLTYELPGTIAGVCRRTLEHNKKKCAGLEFLRNEQLSSYFSTAELQSLPPEIQRFDQSAQNRLVSQIFRQQIRLRQKGLL
jgi:c-di-GMP-binding flagellar brake protein YcgR